MRCPPGLFFDSAKHLAGKRLRGEKKYPVVLTLEPLGSRHSASRKSNGSGTSPIASNLTVEQCVIAMKECHTPIVSIGGVEPLEYPEIAKLTQAVLEGGHYLFLSTDGALIRRRLHMIPPFTKFFWNVRLDGTEAAHEARGKTTGLFREAIGGIKAAKNAGFFVVVSSTIYPDTDIRDLSALYERLHTMHVDGYLLLPHYPEQRLCREGSAKFREKMHQRFREASERLGDYNLLTSPIYLEYLRGERELDCSVWGSPVYGLQGWSSPCGLLETGYAKSYKALLEDTVWEHYGRGLNPQCENCQCHGGYETAALLGMNGKVGDWWKMLAWQFGGNLGEKRVRAQKV
jgi:hopanoid biosynthesis associated radical SAM protein HpnH